MKKFILIMGVLLAFTACAPTAQLVWEQNNTTREAIVYEDHVVVITKTKVTLEEFEHAMERRKKILEGSDEGK